MLVIFGCKAQITAPLPPPKPVIISKFGPKDVTDLYAMRRSGDKQSLLALDEETQQTIGIVGVGVLSAALLGGAYALRHKSPQILEHQSAKNSPNWREYRSETSYELQDFTPIESTNKPDFIKQANLSEEAAKTVKITEISYKDIPRNIKDITFPFAKDAFPEDTSPMQIYASTYGKMFRELKDKIPGLTDERAGSLADDTLYSLTQGHIASIEGKLIEHVNSLQMKRATPTPQDQSRIYKVEIVGSEVVTTQTFVKSLLDTSSGSAILGYKYELKVIHRLSSDGKIIVEKTLSQLPG